MIFQQTDQITAQFVLVRKEELIMKKLASTILKTIIFFMSWAILISFTPDIHTNSQAFLRLWWEFTPLVVVVLLSVVFVFIVEKCKITIPVAPRFLKSSLIGIVLGVLWLGSVVTVFLLTKTMNIQGQNSVDYIWIWILASLLNVAMQELLVRGYLYQLWKHKYNVIVATILTTILFTVMHGGAFEAGIIPVINVISMSIFVTLLLEYTGTIVAPIILGGVSLAGDYPNLLINTFQGSLLISGGTYKFEGSIIVSIANLILITSLLVLNKRKRNDNLSGLLK